MSKNIKPFSLLIKLGICAYAGIPILWTFYLLISSNHFLSISFVNADSGKKQSISPLILTMNELALKHHLSTYRVGDALDSLGLIKMQSIEHLYPIKFDPQSSALLTTTQAFVEPSCSLIEKKADVTLYDCR